MHTLAMYKHALQLKYKNNRKLIIREKEIKTKHKVCHIFGILLISFHQNML